MTYRVRQAVFVRRLKRQVLSHQVPLTVPAVDRFGSERLKLPDVLAPSDIPLVESILEGKTFTLNCDAQEIARFEETCRGRFSYDIPFPDSPDIRQVWEPARLQHITILLVASSRGIDARRSKAFAKDALLGWIDRNPFLTGPNYLSAMECGLRIPVLFHGLKLLADLTNDEVNKISRTIYEHAWWVSRRLSLYTSLGNHTVCECIGLLFAGALFRNILEGKAWLTRATQLLAQELSHQVHGDGGPAEHSFAYHRFVLDLYWLAVSFLEKNRLSDCAGWKPHLLRGESFLASFKDISGQRPSIGDSDDGYAVAPGLAPVRGISESEPAGVHTFPVSGYTVVREADFLLTFDHGPLGMPPLYNHGHADALAVTLSKNGKPFFVDPGTYRYNGVPEWRKYFKGTRAHNTVTVDGEDQAVQETGFVWSRPFKAELTRNEKTGESHVLEAGHNGYRRLKAPVEHRRSVPFFGNSHFLILDTFSGAGKHDFELNYHLHPEVHTQRQDGWWRLQNGDAIVFIRMLKGHDFVSCSGQDDPPFGWYSPAYGVKEKSGVLCCRERGQPSQVSFLTAISLGQPLPQEAYLKRASSL